jgi:hypothetical protein
MIGMTWMVRSLAIAAALVGLVALALAAGSDFLY